MKVVKKYVVVLLILSLAMMIGCGGQTNTNGSDDGDYSDVDELQLIMGHCDAPDPGDPYHSSAVAFAEKARELSGGKIDITVYPNAQLGDERSVIEAVQNGSVDATACTTAVTSNFQPLTKIMDLPYLFNSLEQAREASGSEAAQKILDSMTEVGIKGLAFTENGFRFILNNKHEIKTPKDLVGLKLRVMQSPVYMSFYSELKSNSIPLAFGEVYTAVSQGTVDGFDLPMPVVLSSKLYEVTDYMSDARYTYTSIMIIMNEEKFNSYSERTQDILMEAAKYAREANFAKNDEVMASGYDILKDQIKITPFDQVDFEGFRSASEVVWNEHASSKEAKEILNAILEMTK